MAENHYTESAFARKVAALRAANLAKSVDLSGKRFGFWTVLRRGESRPMKRGALARYVCLCDCGVEALVVAATLRNGTSTSCGCTKRGKAHHDNKAGRTYGLLTVIRRASEIGAARLAVWLCECACGRTLQVRSGDLASGNTVSCGCKRGKWKTPEEVSERRRLNSRITAARRRATKRNAYRPYSKAEFLALERSLYEEAKRLTVETGEQWAVDHIVPLIGPYSKELGCREVCGLHNEHNLQVLKQVENRAKWNTSWPDRAMGG